LREVFDILILTNLPFLFRRLSLPTRDFSFSQHFVNSTRTIVQLLPVTKITKNKQIKPFANYCGLILSKNKVIPTFAGITTTANYS